jgi:hypothetical protein
MSEHNFIIISHTVQTYTGGYIDRDDDERPLCFQKPKTNTKCGRETGDYKTAVTNSNTVLT